MLASKVGARMFKKIITAVLINCLWSFSVIAKVELSKQDYGIINSEALKKYNRIKFDKAGLQSAFNQIAPDKINDFNTFYKKKFNNQEIKKPEILLK